MILYRSQQYPFTNVIRKLLSIEFFLFLLGLVLFFLFLILIDTKRENPVSLFFKPVPQVIFSSEGGFYETPVELYLGSNVSNCSIYYTLDGSDVSVNSILYDEGSSIPIDKTTVIRAKVIKYDGSEGETYSKTYIMENSTLPVVSVITDPENLWDSAYGIYVVGNDVERPNYNQRGAEWERPAHIEIYEPDGENGFSGGAGIRIFGGASRASPQKSLRVCAKSAYGDSVFNYSLFPDNGIDRYNCILLRSSGNDWRSTMMRDAMIQSLVRNLDFDTQAYRPAAVYINGEYFGIHNIREFYDSFYFLTKYNINKKSIVVIEPDKGARNGYPTVKVGEPGDEKPYVELMSYIKNHDLRTKEIFDYVESQVDVDNFTDYNLTQIYVGNDNWVSVNVNMWRFKTEHSEYSDYENAGKYDGRWRWMLYDTDTGFGFVEDYKRDILTMAIEKTQRIVVDKKVLVEDWPSLLLRKLLNNRDYRTYFINRYADLINTVFTSERVINQIDEIHDLIAPEIPRHIEVWGGVEDRQQVRSFSSMEEWESNVEALRMFAKERPYYARLQVVERFGLSGWGTLKILNNETDRGSVKVSTIDVKESYKELVYFKNNAIIVSAIAKPGYVFSEWEGVLSGQPAETEIVLENDVMEISPVFKKDNLWLIRKYLNIHKVL